MSKYVKKHKEPEEIRLRDRFFKFTRRDEKTGCLIWIGGKDKRGYGRLWIGSQKEGTLKKEKSHRVAWILSGREITEDKPCILHNCPHGDNPACCEIEHLWAGTIDENNKDRSKKDNSRKSKRGLPRGVQPNSGRSSSYQARLQVGSKQIYLGSYSTVEEAFLIASTAQKAYDKGRDLR